MQKRKTELNEKQIVKAALKSCGWTQKRLSQALGAENPKIVGNQLSRDSTLTLTTLFAMLDAMGFEIEVHSKYPGMTKEKWILKQNSDPIESEKNYVDPEALEKLKYGRDI